MSNGDANAWTAGVAKTSPMQPFALTVDKFLVHAARWHGATEVVSRHASGAVRRSDYATVMDSAARLSNTLLAGGIAPGDRVATLAMNGDHHLAAWFSIMGIGAICHTLNPRLSREQLVFIINHASDRIILADRAFQPLLQAIVPSCPTVERVAYLDDDDGEDGWSALLGDASPNARWGGFDEESPAGLCYTSGTTGPPKGVIYTHRSNYLHTLMIIQPDVFDLSARDTVLPVVPMYHANAWGLTFGVAAVGAKLVLPGPQLDPAAVHALIEAEEVTMTAGVPTVWQALLPWMAERNLTFSTLRRVMVGGAACPEGLIRDFERHGVEVQHNWGMTETSPLGTTGSPTRTAAASGSGAIMAAKLKQGRVPVGVDMRVVGEDGRELPRDGRHAGNLRVKGHSIVGRYFREERDAVDPDGFFDTGDVGTIGADGLLAITDRAKDVIKSGGEWISSADIENLAASHPAIAFAAAIGVPHPRWGERPLLLVVTKEGHGVSESELRALLATRMARWAVPDVILFVSELPLGATGKIDKRRLREDYSATWRWPGTDADAAKGSTID